MPAFGQGLGFRFEVFAIADVTNYQWYSNNVPIPGANTYYYDIVNAQTNLSGAVYYVTAYNAAGSADSTHCAVTVVRTSDFLLPSLLWSKAASGSTDPTNYMTSNGGAGTPKERCIAYNALSNQLLVVRGPSLPVNIFVVNPDNGAFLYLLNTNGMVATSPLSLCGIGVADDGAVYACSANSATSGDQAFKVYRWADTGPSTVPQLIFGTNSSAGTGNPVQDLVGSQTYRFGDALAVHGAGNNTEIIVDAQNNATVAGILRPVADGTMTNWTQTGYLLQNIAGSYGFGAYGTVIGRSVQFGPNMNGPFGNTPTFWQKRYSTAGTPLAGMGYTLGGGLAPLNVANFSLPLFTNGSAGINFSLHVAAGIVFNTAVNSGGAASSVQYFDLTDPSQSVLLSTVSLPGGNAGTHQANNNAVAQVIFGFNPVTGSNYLFAIEGNNGIAAWALVGGVPPPPVVLSQPQNLRLLEGSSGMLGVGLDQPANVSWFKGTNPPVDTGVRGSIYTILNASGSDAGDYFVTANNANGSVTSRVAHVSVGSPDDNYTLSPIWGAVAGNATFPYVTANGGANTPGERCFAYHALSNQLIVVHCPPASTAYSLYVVDAATGTNYYTLDTTGVVHEGPSEVAGLNPIDLVGVGVADDGAVYICSETPNASGGAFADTTKMLHIYRWADSGPTTASTMVYEGDPSGVPPGINNRWGDVMTVRGSGTNTDLFLNTYDGTYGAVLRPTDSSMTVFSNYWFYDAAGGGSIGRSVQFGPTNTVFEKRKAADLFQSAYNTNSQSSRVVNDIGFSSVTLGGVFVDTAHNLVAGVDFVGTASQKPDAVALYNITEASAPMLLARYNFPANQVANANFICQTVIAGSRVFALDGNNGLMAFYINPPVNSMILNIARSGTNVNLSWGNAEAALQTTASLNPPAWTNLTVAGQTNSVQPIAGESQFYRLVQQR